MVRATNQLPFRVMRVALSEPIRINEMTFGSLTRTFSHSIEPNRYIRLDSDWFLVSALWLATEMRWDLGRCLHESGHLWNRISFYSGSCGGRHYTYQVNSFKKIGFPWADSLVSCGRKTDSCKNIRGFINIRIRADVTFVQRICLFKASLKKRDVKSKRSKVEKA